MTVLSVLLPASMLLLSLGQIGQYLSHHGIFAKLIPRFNGNPNTTVAALHDCSHNYTINIMSLNPVVVYLDGFIKESEVQHLLDITKNQFDDSRVYLNGQAVVNKSYRFSQSALVDVDDPVSQCLSQRLKALMGNVQHEDTERLHLVKYGVGGHFNLHNDWLAQPLEGTAKDGSPRLYNRAGSVFAYLDDDCTGGETYFPEVEGVPDNADGTKFSRSSTGKGLLVKPRRGSAVFWISAHMNGTGDERMRHASLPVTSGTKVGLNMFSIYYLDKPLVGVMKG
ncbi:2og-fe oxygenase family [Podospora aff. communis PSN243]|uniref:2og-fe oxygenase family n=1 Tax=Podospora aff. communis PSN243 TaxID=3040156 RepID=A0AAV9G3B5_9PEZI|nr:2og-fe oxygenase family [Podospora aff. communis PSN243]